MKFAFIINTDGGHPDTYEITCTAGNNENHIYGVTGVEEGVAFAKGLAKEGFELLNLCGDFTAENAADIAAEGMRVKNADYMPEELKKIEALEDLSHYGIIVVDAGLSETVKADKKDPACNAYARFIKDVDGACEAAKELVEEGVAFIELCSWFDKEKTDAVIAAIDGKVPVGTCGEF